MEYILYFLYTVMGVACFYLFRTLLCLTWNMEMYKATFENTRKGVMSVCYLEWNIDEAIFHPKHYLKWSPSQWIKYQRKLHDPE